MGKRSSFPRRKHDQYMTPEGALRPLIPHLPKGPFLFIEPCAGDGQLTLNLERLHGRASMIGAIDIAPPPEAPIWVTIGDALQLHEDDLAGADMFITNPPWTRQLLHPLIEHLSDMRPTWLLFDADWLSTKQAVPYLPRLRKVVTIGRVSWMENGVAGKDNACWYLFDARGSAGFQFFGKGEAA